VGINPLVHLPSLFCATQWSFFIGRCLSASFSLMFAKMHFLAKKRGWHLLTHRIFSGFFLMADPPPGHEVQETGRLPVPVQAASEYG